MRDVQIFWRRNGFDRWYYEISIDDIPQVASIRDFEVLEDAENHAKLFVRELGFKINSDRTAI